MGRKCEKAGQKMVHLDISCSPLALSPLLLPSLCMNISLAACKFL